MAVKVIIADDHELFREGLAMLINSTDEFRVTLQATEGNHLLQLLSLLSNSQDFPDICLLDINMPELNGYDAMKVINTKYPNLNVLALSMLDAAYSILNMLTLGAKGFLHKNCHKDELLDALEHLSTGDFYIPRHYAKLLVPGKKNEISGLTSREIDFLQYCHLDLSYREIGERMNVSERTVHGYRDSLFTKLDCKSRNGLIAFAFKAGVIIE